MKSTEQYIIEALSYFRLFDYPPVFEEIYTFLKKKTSRGRLASVLEKMEKKNMVKRLLASMQPPDKHARYTLGEYGIPPRRGKFKMQNPKFRIDKYKEKYIISQRKLQNFRYRLYVKLLSLFPQIQLVGLSGTVSMMNAKKEDDIDIFIIAAKSRLYTTRFIAIILAKIFGIKRERNSKQNMDKICLNLFFGADDVKIPRLKQTEYVAHEVLQMKPIINKGNIYERFLWANKWVRYIFPNSIINSKVKIQNAKLELKSQKYFVADLLEKVLKKLQLISIKQHQTNEIVTDTQLWFFPEDFEKRLQKRCQVS